MKNQIHSYDTLIVWIRRELRVHDNLALWSAVLNARNIIPVYILPEHFHVYPPARQHMVLDTVKNLSSSLAKKGGALILRRGDPIKVISSLLRETNAAGVYTTIDYHPDIQRRDSSLRTLLESQGKLLKEFQDHVIFGHNEIANRNGNPYTVFTPYKNAWRERRESILPPLPKIRRLTTPKLESEAIPYTITMSKNDASQYPCAGDGEIAKIVRSFLKNSLTEYSSRRDYLGLNPTSRLSHALSLGSLSVRTLYYELNKFSSGLKGIQRIGADTFLNQLIWREFYYQILANYPHVVNGAFKRAYDSLWWSTNKHHFDAWCHGMTGYPIVDAAMRQLNSEGWMHNRGRMIVANFLTKDLHIDWKQGEEYFMRHLVDGDVALR